jgi:hypothetical protein
MFRCVTRVGVLALLVASPALGQDDRTQKVDAGGLTFQAPSAWKSRQPQSQMRRAELKIDPAKGDEEGAELIVFAFPGGAGTVDANVARWQSQFKDKDGNPPKVEVKQVKGQNVDVNRVEIAGHYYPTTFPGQPKQPDRENTRLLGAIVLTKDVGYFLRVVGPDKTVSEARPAFDKLITTMKTEEK